MRIVYPMVWARPGRQASQAQSMATAAALARRGHAVTLMLPQGPDDPILSTADLRDRFDVHGDFGLLQIPSRWAGDRLHRTLLWLHQVFRHRATREAEILYSRIPVMIGIGLVAPIPFATDLYRPWPDEWPFIRWSVGLTARSANCLGLILHSAYAAAAYRRAGVREDRLLVAHNGFDPPEERLQRDAARSRLSVPVERRIAVYAGRLDGTKGLDRVLDLADRRPDVLFVLIGSEGNGAIEQAAAARDNVRIVPWLERRALFTWLAAADVLVIPPSREPLDRFGNCVLPLKVFAYLAAGRPILAPRSPDTAELLEHGETAWLVDPDDGEAAAAGLARVLGDVALAGRLGANAARLSAGLTWDLRAQAIETFLADRLAQRSVYSKTVSPVRIASTGAAHAPRSDGT